MRFHDRKEAGERLATRLRQERLDRPWVLALRGPALEVAAPVADALAGQVVPVAARRASEAPKMEAAIRHTRLLEDMGISGDVIDRVASVKQGGARQRRPARPHREALPDLTGRAVVVVDDGLSAPDEVARLAARAAAQHPARLLVALPLADEAMRAAVADHEHLVLRDRPREGPEAEGYIMDEDADVQLRVWHQAQEQLKRLAALP